MPVPFNVEVDGAVRLGPGGVGGAGGRLPARWDLAGEVALRVVDEAHADAVGAGLLVETVAQVFAGGGGRRAGLLARDVAS